MVKHGGQFLQFPNYYEREEIKRERELLPTGDEMDCMKQFRVRWNCFNPFAGKIKPHRTRNIIIPYDSLSDFISALIFPLTYQGFKAHFDFPQGNFATSEWTPNEFELYDWILVRAPARHCIRNFALRNYVCAASVSSYIHLLYSSVTTVNFTLSLFFLSFFPSLLWDTRGNEIRHEMKCICWGFACALIAISRY